MRQHSQQKNMLHVNYEGRKAALLAGFLACTCTV